MQDSADFVKAPKLISIFIDVRQRININKIPTTPVAGLVVH